MYQMFAADPRARAESGHPPPPRGRFWKNDPERIKLMNSLPAVDAGAPPNHLLRRRNRHGRQLYIGDRNGVRTPIAMEPDSPMPASHTADPQRLYLPPIMDSDLWLRGRSTWRRRLATARRSSLMKGACWPESARTSQPLAAGTLQSCVPAIAS